MEHAQKGKKRWQEAMFQAADTIEKAETATAAGAAAQPTCTNFQYLCKDGVQKWFVHPAVYSNIECF